jgi:hypothetical protein
MAGLKSEVDDVRGFYLRAVMRAGLDQYGPTSCRSSSNDVGHSVSYHDASLKVDFALTRGLKKHPWTRLAALAGNTKRRQRCIRMMGAVVEGVQGRRSCIHENLDDLLVQLDYLILREESSGNDRLIADNDQAEVVLMQLPQRGRDPIQNVNVGSVC